MISKKFLSCLLTTLFCLQTATAGQPTLLIVSEPLGATIIINGQSIGTTPLRIPLPDKSSFITLKIPGYGEFSRMSPLPIDTDMQWNVVMNTELVFNDFKTVSRETEVARIPASLSLDGSDRIDYYLQVYRLPETHKEQLQVVKSKISHLFNLPVMQCAKGELDWWRLIAGPFNFQEMEIMKNKATQNIDYIPSVFTALPCKVTYGEVNKSYEKVEKREFLYQSTLGNKYIQYARVKLSEADPRMDIARWVHNFADIGQDVDVCMIRHLEGDWARMMSKPIPANDTKQLQREVRRLQKLGLRPLVLDSFDCSKPDDNFFVKPGPVADEELNHY